MDSGRAAIGWRDRGFEIPSRYEHGCSMMARTALARIFSRHEHLRPVGWGIAMAWTAAVAVVFLVWGTARETVVVGYVLLWLLGLGGIATGYQRLVTQIAKRIRATDRMFYLASHDGLTRLLGRHHFFERLAQAFEDDKVKNTRTALMMVGLDRFRTINDVLGHDAGDQVLREVARRLLAVVDRRDVVARVGGDEFAVLLSNLPDAHVAARVANGILESISAPIRLPGDDLAIGASIGIAFSPDDTDNPEDLFRLAGVAMHDVKDLEKPGFSFAGAAGTATLGWAAQEKARASRYG